MSVSLPAEVMPTTSFRDLGLPDNLLKLLDELGYQTPSPIQAQIIPEILAGHDVMGQAQTGTGKTAAFALPGLCLLKLDIRAPQILVLAPTRELATQVAEAYERYAQHLPQVRCVALCGGQEYRQQISQLRQGPQVVVGTPGRLMDHMRRGTLDLSNLQQVVLDEADEMLRMGFIDDVEWILQQAPKERQTALFSATMPKPIFQIAQQYLKNPVDIRIKTKAMTATTITQKYWMVAGASKMEALTRLLEVTVYSAAIVFVRTKTATVEIAEVLRSAGFRVLALNGDIDQKLRQRSVDQLKSGEVDILVATDVAARGLDVERISLVINYDIPFDPEAYVHRIGRTGRAGREGQAILFVAQRERRLLASIERVTRQHIEAITLPSFMDVQKHRLQRLQQQITEALPQATQSKTLKVYQDCLEDMVSAGIATAEQIALTLMWLSQKGQSTGAVTEEKTAEPRTYARERTRDRDSAPSRSREPREPREPRERSERSGEKRERSFGDKPVRERADRDQERAPRPRRDSQPMETYRVALGKSDNVSPRNLVGAIANEGGIDSANIGRIEIFDTYSTVDLPVGIDKKICQDLKAAWVCGKQLNLTLMGQSSGSESASPSKSSFAKKRDTQSRDTQSTVAKTPTPKKTYSAKGDRSERPRLQLKRSAEPKAQKA